MVGNTLVVVARPEWVSGGGPWGSTFKVTLLNLSDEVVVNPVITFKVGAKQVIQNNYGLVWTRSGEVVSGRLVAERNVIPPRASTEFRLSVRGEGQDLGPLPRDFTVNGRPADPPRDSEPPTTPKRVRATLVGSALVTLGWDASTDNVAVAGYRVTYSKVGGGVAQTLSSTRPAITLMGLSAGSEYQVSVVALDVSDNVSASSDTVKIRTSAAPPDAGDWDVPRAPFVDYTSWPTPRVSEYGREAGLDGFFLGFLVARPDGGARAVSWGGNTTLVDSEDGQSYSGDATVSDYGKRDIEAFRRSGGTVVLSFGGASNVPLEAEETEVAMLVATYAAVLRNYGVRHLDFDFEGAFLHDEDAQVRHLAALSQLLAVYPTLKLSYTLPADGAPGSLVGFNDGGVRFLQKLSSAGIEPSLINGLLMEFGQSAPVDALECCVHALRGMHAHVSAAFPRWDAAKVWRRLGACPMFGRHPNGREFTLEHQRGLVEFAREHQLGCLSGWDATRDANQGRLPECERDSGGDLSRCTLTPQQPFDFGRCISAHGAKGPSQEVVAE
ncbi:fibronectin type III domain-containing protein [Myxococcus sp. CA056]|uniref:fibronectin type III domain-containing protein n=1 Tax=Myxococcus sp. CA056 TaxID=2741740 RepID=UPI00157A8981|nr:fibronectin type III domain-containing protein [Myxococcus sp. CA056]NTX14985.1 fibronectin type III domain-containing protein [Myxococcus sp. CA056]